mgnify:CR=1 FL=1
MQLVQIDDYEQISRDIFDRHKKLSDTITPKVYVKQKQGFDYVDEAYMRNLLNQVFPGWSWEIVKYEFMGDKAISVHGSLKIIEAGIPRTYDAIAAHRIAVSKSNGNYVDLGNDLKSANSDCFKVAVNRLCNIADDVYRKQVKDMSLTDEQKDMLYELSHTIKEFDSGLSDKIVGSIEQMSVNASNYEATISKLESIIKEKGAK